MDRIAIGYLAELQNDAKLPPELAAILSDRAGEVGRHASAMEEVLRDLHGPEDFNQRLLAHQPPLSGRQFTGIASAGIRLAAQSRPGTGRLSTAGAFTRAQSRLEKYYHDIAAAHTPATQPGVAK